MIECPVAPSLHFGYSYHRGHWNLSDSPDDCAGVHNYIVFVVRDDAESAALLYQQPVTTNQAYTT